MQCRYFKKCASCTLHDMSYAKQLEFKATTIKNEFKIKNLDIIKSKEIHFRNRAEFRIFHEDDRIFYAMHSFDKKLLKIDECLITSPAIYKIMPKLLKELSLNNQLKRKLFAVEFLSSSTNNLLITLIYHKKIDQLWREEAEKLATKLKIDLIGRSKKVKKVITKESIDESFKIENISYKYFLKDNSFIQPNAFVNQQMIKWVCKNIKNLDSDLLELYCGHGNFTLPLSKKFKKVLATEISKSSIKLAKEHVKLNNITNIEFVRLSSQELIEALQQTRVFKRLRDIDLKKYNFSHIFVDPPRAGVDEKTLKFLKEFKNIIYISCNPKTLKRDLEILKDKFKIVQFAIFDQFAYTNHVECGVILTQK